jgi:serine/threonine-protein kinase SRPK3
MGLRSRLKRALTENDNDKFLKVDIGQVFYDRYRVETHLGSGRYASVWLVIDNTSVYLPL